MTLNQNDLRVWALIQAELVRVEAMKALNVEREHHGYAQAYDEKAFHDVADVIEEYAKQFVSCPST